jgi:DinB superfamily
MGTASTIPLPADAQQLLDEIDAADRAADSLTANLTDEQFHWQPDGGRRWSIAQCLEHLATANDLYGGAIDRAIEAAQQKGSSRQGPFAPGFFGRKFIGSLEPPVKRRGRSPSQIRPGSQLSRLEILRRYHAAHDRVKQMVSAAATIDANRATFQNPFITWIRVKVATGLRIIAAHNRRHLWQAQQVTEHPEFPKGR